MTKQAVTIDRAPAPSARGLDISNRYMEAGDSNRVEHQRHSPGRGASIMDFNAAKTTVERDLARKKEAIDETTRPLSPKRWRADEALATQKLDAYRDLDSRFTQAKDNILAGFNNTDVALERLALGLPRGKDEASRRERENLLNQMEKDFKRSFIDAANAVNEWSACRKTYTDMVTKGDIPARIKADSDVKKQAEENKNSILERQKVFSERMAELRRQDPGGTSSPKEPVAAKEPTPMLVSHTLTPKKDFSLELPGKTTKTTTSNEPFVGFIAGYLINIGGNEKQGLTHDMAKGLGSSDFQVVEKEDYGRLFGDAQRAHEEGRPVVITAHSMGNKYMVDYFLPTLQAKGIEVDVLIMEDPSYLDPSHLIQPKNGGKIPSNVKHVICARSEGAFNGLPLTKDMLEDPSKTTFENVQYEIGHLEFREVVGDITQRTMARIKTQRREDAILVQDPETGYQHSNAPQA